MGLSKRQDWKGLIQIYISMRLNENEICRDWVHECAHTRNGAIRIGDIIWLGLSDSYSGDQSSGAESMVDGVDVIVVVFDVVVVGDKKAATSSSLFDIFILLIEGLEEEPKESDEC